MTIGLSASLALLGAMALRDRDSDYFDDTIVLRQLHEVDARSEAQVLRALTGIDANYDSLAASLSETARLSNLIEARISMQSHADGARMRQDAKALSALEREKSEAIEQYKSANSLLHNSLVFLPIAESDFGRADAATALAGESARAHAAAREHAHAALVAILSQARTGAIAVRGDAVSTLDLLRLDRQALAGEAGRSLDIFLAHAGAAIAAQRRVNALIRDITTLGTSQRIDQIGDLLGAEQKDRSGSRLLMRNFLLAFAALVLSLFILAAIRLSRANAALGRAMRQMQGANEHLELRVAERTTELFDANLIVRNSTTILYRMAATPAMTLTYISPNVARYGLDAAALMKDRHWAARMIAPEDLAAVGASIRSFLAGHSNEATLEYRLLDSLGPTRWVENRCLMVRDAQGVVVEIEGFVFDVTARKEAQLALKRSEDFARGILDSISVEVAVLDSQGIITAVNEPWRDFARLNATAVDRPVAHADVGSNYLGASSCQRPSEDDAEGSVAYDGIRRVLAGALDRFDLEYPCHSPERERWFRMSVTPLGSAANGVVVTHEDITERKRTEAALRASERLLERTGQIGGIGGWKFDLVTQAIEWTAQTARIHGVDPGWTPTFDDAMAFYPSASRAILEDAFAMSLETGGGYDCELQLNRADGTPIWVRTVSEVEFDDGRAVRMSGTFQDVTTRHALEQELRASTELLSTALETLPCGICVFDADKNLVAWNSEYLRLLSLPARLFEAGAPRLEDIARHLAEHGEYGPGDVETLASEVARNVMAHETHHFERVRPDGSTLEIRGARMPGGGVVATFTDISGRRAAEASAQQSTRLLSNAIEAIDEAFVLYGADDRLIFCNETYRTLFGPLAHLVVAGATFDDLALISQSSGIFKAMSADLPDAFHGELPAGAAEPRARLRRLVDGRVLRAVSKTMPDGHRVDIWADVSELSRATEVAEQALLAKGQFLANISHEIRTPMNAILGLLTLLQRGDLAPRELDYVVRTDGAARALLGVLNAVLDFSKIESGAMQLDAAPFEMESLLRELSLIASANVGSKALDLRFEIDPDLPPILVGDAVRLQQVLVNLMGNAVKFTPEGFVELRLHVLDRNDQTVSVEIVVRDTGIGIAPENQQRIFAGFTQAEASITRRFGGTGLGLAISHHLVELMGGVLTVESVVGEGSSFRFLVTLGTPGGAAPDNLPADRAAPLRVLLVADDPAAGECAARMARTFGWSVVMARDGDESRHEFQAARSSRPFDLAIVDGSRIGPARREWHGHVGDRPFPGGLPVVMLGSLHARERAWARDAGDLRPRERYLVKPFTAAMLRGVVQELLDARGVPEASRASAGPRPQRLAGVRILVVEDNVTNQLIARELLEAEGATISVAADGAQAVRVLPESQADFDVVLMDLQMPVMDGLTAARRIREIHAPRALPIIAMTANASTADRQGCVDAGMDGHIGKPFDLDALVDLLRRHTDRSPIEPPWPPGGALSPHLLELAARAGADLTATLARLGGNTRLHVRLLAAFIDGLRPLIAELRACADGADLESACRLLHATRGLAGTLGLASLAAAAASAEAACSGDPVAQAGVDAILQCCGVLADAQAGLATLLRACDDAWAPTAAVVDRPGDAEVLVQLERIVRWLRESDMQALDPVSALARRVGDALGDELGVLDDLVGQLQFDRAADLCDRLIEELKRA